jgi:hypothetical protein
MTSQRFLLPVVALAAFAAGFAAATAVHVFDAEGMRRRVAEEYEAKTARAQQATENRYRLLQSFMEGRLKQARQAGVHLSRELAKRDKELAKRDAEIERLKQAAMK